MQENKKYIFLGAFGYVLWVEKWIETKPFQIKDLRALGRMKFVFLIGRCINGERLKRFV
jgi:hypothetical protein